MIAVHPLTDNPPWLIVAVLACLAFGVWLLITKGGTR